MHWAGSVFLNSCHLSVYKKIDSTIKISTVEKKSSVERVPKGTHARICRVLDHLKPECASDLMSSVGRPLVLVVLVAT